MSDFKIDTNDKLKTADRLKKIRNDMDLTQEEFAEKLGLSVNSIKKMEKGEYNISINNLRKLHQEYKISTDYLLYGKQESIDDIWFQLQNADDNVKIRILMRLIRYFGCEDRNFYIDKEKNGEIFATIEELLYGN